MFQGELKFLYMMTCCGLKRDSGLRYLNSPIFKPDVDKDCSTAADSGVVSTGSETGLRRNGSDVLQVIPCVMMPFETFLG